ncbi:ABC transporter ATP-binding protein [Thermosyntropha sp.]|uniref:ABC transporter ATP-binding protein n=1 Tax=Thermosyntropha sp. TaxID=2740820 RepID=UPI002600B977|nr:ABC transporter ATP-binding protein [Thermosyntropha sp.]MBO8158774.1 ABC transporter ATP-binding protein [Thermosyntropha sp.]
MLIETINLTKRYGNNLACDDICLSVAEGQVFGLLGPNGAGKSTLVKMILGLVKPSSGRALLNGIPVSDPRSRLNTGYLPELFRFYDWLSGYELLKISARFYDIPPHRQQAAIDKALETVGLKGREKEEIKNYSKGMQQRLGLAAAILHDPKLIFLDEPTSALDPVGRKEVREIIEQLKASGTTLFINSHLLSEMEASCTHLAFIKKGRLVASGKISDFVLSSHQLSLKAEGVPAAILSEWEREGKLLGLDDNRTFTIGISDEEEVPVIISRLAAGGVRIYRATMHGRSLEEVFLDLVKD